MIGFNFYSFHLSAHGTNLKLVCWTFPRLSSCWLGVGMLCLKPTHHSHCNLNPIIFLNYCCYFGFIFNNEHLWHDNYRVFLLPLPIFHTEKEKGKILASKQSRRPIEFSNFSFLEEFTNYSQSVSNKLIFGTLCKACFMAQFSLLIWVQISKLMSSL